MDINTTRSAAISMTAVVLMLAAAAGFSPASVGVAYAGGTITQTLNVAVATPCCGNPEPNGSGVVQDNSVSSADVFQADSLSGSVTIPIPSPNLGIGSAAAADIRLVFSRAGADYAECYLDLTRNEGSQATYMVNIVKAKTRVVTLFKQVTGFCDIDLVTGGISPGIPEVQAGDLVTASSVLVNSSRIPFLQGIFVQQ